MIPDIKTKRKKVYPHGNYAFYYLGRTHEDRLNVLKKEWFHNKDWSDIGCNDGSFTLALFKAFQPKSLFGFDIDFDLIKAARNNQRAQIKDINIAKQIAWFHTDFCQDFCLTNEKRDIITCFSVTKWIQLHHGDDGIKKLFQKVKDCLSKNGYFILEP
eukprot:UN23501